MKKHFVTFYSPGTFFSETSQKPIDSWNIDEAKSMARDIVERYNATPYGFQFSTRERGENDLDSKETSKSNMFFLGGRIETIEEVKARNDPNERILLSNMVNNGYDRIWVSTSGWKSTLPFGDEDIRLEVK